MREGDGSWRGGARLRLALVAVVVLALSALFAVPALAFEDFSGGAFQILAPGEEGANPFSPFSTDQGVLYDKLTPRQGNVTTKQLEENYLSEKFGVQGAVTRTEETGRPGLEILRDSHDIPHIYGTTRADVMFGSGWVAAEDRGLLLKLGLGPAYTAALDVPGINPFGLLLTARKFTPSAEATKYVEEEKQSLVEEGPKGEQSVQDLEAWAEGINAYEATLPESQRLKHVTLADAIAGFAFIGSIFGNGGGQEVQNSQFLANLEAQLGTEEGLKVYRDLRETNDPEAPTTASKAFPYDGVPTGATPGAAVIDPGSISNSANKAAKLLTASRRRMSNFLVVGANDSKSGHPLAVMGPQLGYFWPEIVFQADMHGPGVDASGIVAPISPYVFIGRGRDFAWSLTSADSENVQTFLEKLCNPDEETEGPPTRKSTHYLYKGECVAMKTFHAGILGAGGGEPEHEVTFLESVHGPIQGTVTVKGVFYAIAKDRSTRGRDPAGEVAFNMLDSDEVHSPQTFFEAANHLETTFNMSYLDNEHVAYFSAGRLPILAPGTDPSLPTFGTGEYDWQGFLGLEEHPHEVDPAGNVFTNWNNKPAPEWGAASDNWHEGPIDRVQLYSGFGPKMTETKDVEIMNRAATEDLRALKVWPTIKQVLAASAAPSKLAEEAVGVLNTWIEKGASRLGGSRPLASGAAVIDAFWKPVAEAVLSPTLGPLLPEFESVAQVDDPPSSSGSSFGAGWEGYVYKDLRTLLGDPVAQPYSRIYCGGGSLTGCSASLWSAIQTAAEAVAAKQGSNPAKWKAAKVRIEFPPGLLPFTMRWTNRSTFQQVIEFTGHAP